MDDRPELRYADCPTTRGRRARRRPARCGVAAGVGHPAAGPVQRRVRRRRLAGRGDGGRARRPLRRAQRPRRHRLVGDGVHDLGLRTRARRSSGRSASSTTRRRRGATRCGRRGPGPASGCGCAWVRPAAASTWPSTRCPTRRAASCTGGCPSTGPTWSARCSASRSWPRAGPVRRTTFARWPCSVARTVDIIGDWWTPLVLRECCYGVRRFEDLQRVLGIGRNVLTQRLNRLVDEGLLERVPVLRATAPRRVRADAQGAGLLARAGRHRRLGRRPPGR